jgi:Mg-chelatase subunit ChlD
MLGGRYFKFRSIQHTPATIRSKSILVFDKNTSLNLFVPHRKSGVDMVIVVDASGSMDLRDYVGSDGHPRTRLQGVREALEILLQRRLTSGSRVSSIAIVVFGANTQMLYPSHCAMVELKSSDQVMDMQRSIRDLSEMGLQRRGVDRTRTEISRALQYAAELLDYYAQESNEKMLVLLSDGADWTEDTTGDTAGEVVRTTHDPAVLADSLHYDSKLRIHTVSISDERALRQYENQKYWSQGWAIPNTKLLDKIADFTQGLFLASPDARSLARLFEELGEGALYPV